MSGLELNKARQSIIEAFRHSLKSNLFAIISIGSFALRNYQESWSDIDLLIVLERLKLKNKEQVAYTKEKLEKNFHCRFGINIITKQEAISPIKPEITLDGKTLQGLLDLDLHPEHLLYGKSKKQSLFTPDRRVVKIYSLLNIAMFLLRNRKSLIDNGFEKNRFKIVVEREIRAAFIMTKLGIQYQSGKNCDTYQDIIRHAKVVFPELSFSTLNKNKMAISEWGQIHSTKKLRKILERTDQYIERFSSFIFHTSTKSA